MNIPPNLQKNVELKNLNTFGIEAKADYYASIQSTDQLRSLLSNESLHTLPKFILGEGSNILFTKNYSGLVIKNNIKGITHLEEDDNHIWIKVGAGENWHNFVLYCLEHEYSGIENLSLIPGTVGAAPIQNIGAYGVELKDVFYQLEALDLQNGALCTFTNKECKFGYRDSIFKNSCKNQYVILSVTFQLNKKPNFHLEYGNIKETLQLLNIKELNAKTISDAIIHIRRSKLADPKLIGNAGSFFKNPIIPYAQFIDMQKTHPCIPHFSHNDDLIKLSAAWLIEQCGWKGKRIGNVGVYDKQALIIVNYGNGSSLEIQELAENIRQSINQRFGIWLTPEVNYI